MSEHEVTDLTAHINNQDPVLLNPRVLESKKLRDILGAEKPEDMASTTKLVSVALLWVLILFGTLAIIQVVFKFNNISGI